MAEPRRLPGAVIFDCDGVLVDSEPATEEVIMANLARHGLPLDRAAYRAMALGGTMRMVGEAAAARGASIPEGWVEAAYREMFARLSEGVAPIPGVVALLDALDAAGVPYAVASNGPREKMAITLGQTGLWPRFEGRILSAHEEGVAKPDPGLFLNAAARLGRAPQDCVVIEDSPAGAAAARAAGMRCLGFAPEGEGAALAALGATVVRSMAEAARELGL
ncbi:MAG: HAD family phosphatase [Rhodobacteraceae bacterium]|nr:HAD family phosphatase [Paracoccaceae bacterium]